MKAKLYDLKGAEKGSVDLPKSLGSRIRSDILLKVFEAQKGLFASAYGAKEGAGAQYSASGISIKARHKWKGTYGKSISRVPRKIMSRHGASFNWVGATVSSARGGRKPHAPRSEKNLVKKINKKELEMALKSAILGTFDEKSIEAKYGRKIPSGIVFDDKIVGIKTKEFVSLVKKIFGDEKVFKEKSIRAGIGKLRGRKYKSTAGMLFVVGSDEKMKRSGVDVVSVSDLAVKDLAPNGVAGRVTGYTEKAIKELGERFA